MEEKDYDKCLRCGRKLKNAEARKIGYGKICFTKMIIENHTKRLLLDREQKDDK